MIEEKTTIQDVLQDFQNNPSSLIPVLQATQDTFGYISEANVYEISDFLDIPTAKIYGVVTFYAQFRLKPMGRHVINLCRGTACHVKGSKALVPIIEQELKCKAGDTTDDGRFTFNLVACLGCCALAPVINIDDDFYGNVKTGEIKRLLKKYK